MPDVRFFVFTFRSVKNMKFEILDNVFLYSPVSSSWDSFQFFIIIKNIEQEPLKKRIITYIYIYFFSFSRQYFLL